MVVVIAAFAAAPVSKAAAGTVPTPQARAFAPVHDTPGELAYAFGEPLPGGSDRIGVFVRCRRSSGVLDAGLFFGVFPEGVPVQAAVHTAAGAVERFGPVVRLGPAHGFHDTHIVGRADVLRLLHVAFSEGALISNGHNSVWNRIPEAKNRAAREALAACAGVP
ncbi:MAG: hypothetical protein OXP28_07305 [Gammaproteobacteria bacterium]|nr:hypothetical protein [Deltaproteobacteria bacterium]MDE0224924.1 hypothetical protein [Gammaproteobacteria bacterium]